MRWIVRGVALFLLMVSPAIAQKVDVDYDGEFDFAGARTIAWLEGTPVQNELMEKRIRTAIQTRLEKSGLVFTEEGKVDLYVTSHGSATNETKSGSPRVGIGVTRYTGRLGVSLGGSIGAKPKTLKVGMLVIELRDAESKALVWQATATDTLKDEAEKNKKLIDQAVEKAFKKFPPKKK